jgi:hypothetical protein
MITFKQTGNFNLTEKFLIKSRSNLVRTVLERYAKEGVSALSAATPRDTGETAAKWDYEIKITRTGYSLTWTNSSVSNGAPVVILIQYGHGTRNGGYVEGRDFINPAIKPILDRLTENLWKEVSNP